ncbi:hypothetical protein [Halioglobus sp. Uisw_031]|uniref:hypothetical protein n=1 Tax=Halioglobus sp. Uisw_031 TaxID=3230977 RepID=UPI0039E85BCC
MSGRYRITEHCIDVIDTSGTIFSNMGGSIDPNKPAGKTLWQGGMTYLDGITCNALSHACWALSRDGINNLLAGVLECYKTLGPQ